MIALRMLIRTLAALLIAVILMSTALAQDTLLISYQGRLTDDSGEPVTGAPSMAFTIYDGTGVSKWSESHPTVPVNAGLFNIILGSQTALPDSVFTGDDRYLGITVSGDPEITPRTLFTSAPRAAVSKRVAGDIITSPGSLRLYDIDPTSGSETSVKMTTGLAEKGIIIVDSKPGSGAENDSMSVQLGINPENKGIIIVDSKPGDAAAGSQSIGISVGLEEQGIIIVDSKPGSGAENDSMSVQLGINPENKGIIIVDSKPGDGTAGASIALGVESGAKGIIIVDSKPESVTEDSMAVSMEANSALAELTLFKGTTSDEPDIALRVNNYGARVGIGTNTPSDELYVVGNITATGDITELSSLKYKKGINRLNNALGIINNLRGVRFNWRIKDYPKLKFTDDPQIGMIAEEVESILPELVHTDANGEKSVNYSKMTAVLIEALKEQQGQIEALSKRIEELEGTKISSR